jgi:hypothetical protein
VPAAYLRTTPWLQPCAHGIYFDHLQTYLLYHPDLRASGIVEEQQATEHYIKQGAVLSTVKCLFTRRHRSNTELTSLLLLCNVTDVHQAGASSCLGCRAQSPEPCCRSRRGAGVQAAAGAAAVHRVHGAHQPAVQPHRGVLPGGGAGRGDRAAARRQARQLCALLQRVQGAPVRPQHSIHIHQWLCTCTRHRKLQVAGAMQQATACTSHH